ncbi:MAG TPA: hypothetical protein VIU61_27450 [Kofleriaceae bacterium]
MGEPACDLLTAELALDRLEAELATELPAHVRAFAASAKPPPAPEALRRPRSLVVARQALAHPLLADRALALVRLIAPIAIDDDPRVVAALAYEPTWSAYDRLAAARDAVARERFALPVIELVHRLHGAPDLSGDAPWPDPIAGWTEPDGARVSIDDAWQAIAARFTIGQGVVIAPRDGARPRAFIVEPRREVIVVVPRELRTPADRFAALHELGHVVVAMLVGLVPRVVDEAAASHVARLLETDTPDLPGWFSPLAVAARARRVALARALDAIERGAGTRVTEAPPWALWHDPGAQATYVAAESLADGLAADVVHGLVAARNAVDRATRL